MWWGAALLCAGLVLLRALLSGGAERSEVAGVAADFETEPVPSAGDAADDPCIWIHPDDPEESLIVGTDKGGGIGVWDLRGRELQYVEAGRPNNVDVRCGFPLGERKIALLAVSERSTNEVLFFTIDPSTRRLEPLPSRGIEPGISIYGCAMYRSEATGKYFIFVTSYSGRVEQWEVHDGGSGRIGGRLARRFDVGSEVEGCVADDELGNLYLAEEDVAIWKYGAEPDAGEPRRIVDRAGRGHRLAPDIEGLALYALTEGRGYLIASSQSRGEFVIYRREEKNEYVGTFRIVASERTDATSDTDGIEAASASLGDLFPAGLFVAQDGFNDDGYQNFKLVPWERIARAMTPPLLSGTTEDTEEEGGEDTEEEE